MNCRGKENESKVIRCLFKEVVQKLEIIYISNKFQL
jgi:hypothetical protein